MKKSINKAGWLCGISLFLLAGVTLHAQTQVWLDKQVTIQPIIVRNTAGTVASNPALELFAEETQKIWAQAGIEVKFNSFDYFNSDNYLTASPNVADPDYVGAMGQVIGQTWSSVSLTVIKLFFVQSLGSGVLGFSTQSGFSDNFLQFGGSGLNINQQTTIAISDAAFAYNAGNGRIDVVAHELGHILGLFHGSGPEEFGLPTLGAGGALNLMTTGNNRTSPTFITGIYPDGTDADQMTGTIGGTNWGSNAGPIADVPIEGFQIDRARAMTAVVANTSPHFYVYTPIPEPATTTAIAGASMLVLVGLVRLRRTRAHKGSNPTSQA